MEQAVIHTDGACSGNPGPGGFGAIIVIDGVEAMTVTGGDPRTTNSRMELSAVIEAMRALRQKTNGERVAINVRSDSKYVTDAFNQGWLKNWERNGWRTANKKPVANQDLWRDLAQETDQQNVTFTWVQGHSGDPMNERCDRLAVAEAAVATSTYEYWTAEGEPRSTRTSWEPQPDEARPQAATPPPSAPGDEAMRLLEAMSVALDECETFESFRERMRKVLDAIEW